MAYRVGYLQARTEVGNNLDFFTLVGVVRRRWHVVGLGLVLTALLTIGVGSRVEPTYTARGSTVLLLPSTIADPNTGRQNPYLGFGSVQIPASILTEAVSQPQVRAEIASEGGTAEYEVVLDPSTPAPLIVVVTTGEDAEEVLRTVGLVMDRLSQELVLRQEAVEAPAATWLTLDPLAQPDEASPQLGSKMRAQAVTLALGFAASVTVAVLIDSIAARRAEVRRLAVAAAPARKELPKRAGSGWS